MSDEPSLRESPDQSFIMAYEKAETLERMAQASMQVALNLQHQADQQRRAAEGLFKRLVYAQTSESARKDGSSPK